MTDSRPILTALTSAQQADLLARLDQSIDRSGGPEACHPYTGGSLVRGYGVLWIRQADGTRRQVKAHRVIHEVTYGHSESADHACHDHLTCPGGNDCPHRRCCNPRHLEAMTVGENASRAQSMRYREQCDRGHVMDDENVYTSPSGERTCRKCAAENAREARRRARQQRPVRERKRTYRPRGMSREQLVEWALDVEGNDDPDICWEWRDATLDGEGYVQVALGGRKINAHRLVHEVLIGPIPSEHVVDHACHDPEVCDGGRNCPHRQCVNPAHLIATTGEHNMSAARSARRRVTHCKHDHEFTEENTWTDKRGSRHCRTCMRERQRGLTARH